MQEITLPVCELKQALPGLNKIIGKSRTLPVLQSVRIARDVNGRISIMATDLDSFATYNVKETQPGPAIEILMPFDQLTKTVKGLKSDGTLDLVPDGKEKVKLRYSIAGNQVEQNINTLAADEFPPVPKVNQPSIPLEAGFGLALRQALECCSEDPSRRILKGACLDVTDKKLHYVVGTNGRCLFSANSFCFDLQKSVIIPDSKFLEWTDLMDEETCSLAVDPGEEEQPAKNGKSRQEAQPGWIQFTSPRWTFITKAIDGKYPNWQQAIPTTNGKWTHILLSDEAVNQMLQVIPKLPGDYSPNYPIRLRVNGENLTVEGRQKDEEDTWTSIPVHNVTVTGKPVTVALNRHYLLNALRFGLNLLEIEDTLSPVVLSNAGKKMVIMPINLEGPVKVQPAAQPTSEATTPAAEQNQPPAQSEAQTEERTEMPRTARATTPEAMTTFQPVETPANNNGNGSGNGSAVKSMVEHVEQIKENLKSVIRDLNSVIDTVKLADKERKSSEKEIESIRSKLRQIQSVAI